MKRIAEDITNMFKGGERIFEREMKDTDRKRVLLETVNYQVHIEIEKDMVKKVG